MTGVRHTAWQGLAAAVGLHVGLLLFLFLADPAEPAAPRRYPPVRVRVVATRPPAEKKPAPATPPAPPQEPVAADRAAPRLETPTRTKKTRKAARTASLEAPPEKVTPAEPAPASRGAPGTAASRPRRFTVAMEATVPSGGVAVPAVSGGDAWVAGAPDGAKDGERVLPPRPAQSDGSGVEDGQTEGPVSATALTEFPTLLAQPSAAELRAAYPEAARRDGLEADVGLRILVSATGAVTEVRVSRSAGQGFDQAALRLVKSFRFRPGRRGARAVAVWIPWIYKFRLDG